MIKIEHKDRHTLKWADLEPGKAYVDHENQGLLAEEGGGHLYLLYLPTPTQGGFAALAKEMTTSTFREIDITITVHR